MINDERWKSLGETERNEKYTTVQQKKDGLQWCGKDHSSVDEYPCVFCDGTGSFVDSTGSIVDSTFTPCDACEGSGHYSDICCEYHAEQIVADEYKQGKEKSNG